MRFVTIYKDISKIETKLIKNLTGRQIAFFGAGGVIGFTAFWYSHATIGYNAAIYLMFAIVLPFGALALYKNKKTGRTLEKKIAILLRAKCIRPQIRTYHSENIYDSLQKQIHKEREARHLARIQRAASKGTQLHHRETAGTGRTSRSNG
ncbi:PrgI family protein [Ethanoligenens sp.]|uniref:PrgI family protein n=1 Tax=Ethanoligenens sp. TaxID=2099655 RepID=UPI0039ED8133